MSPACEWTVIGWAIDCLSRCADSFLVLSCCLDPSSPLSFTLWLVGQFALTELAYAHALDVWFRCQTPSVCLHQWWIKSSLKFSVIWLMPFQIFIFELVGIYIWVKFFCYCWILFELLIGLSPVQKEKLDLLAKISPRCQRMQKSPVNFPPISGVSFPSAWNCDHS